jgi:hypothetical protein
MSQKRTHHQAFYPYIHPQLTAQYGQPMYHYPYPMYYYPYQLPYLGMNPTVSYVPRANIVPATILDLTVLDHVHKKQKVERKEEEIVSEAVIDNVVEEEVSNEEVQEEDKEKENEKKEVEVTQTAENVKKFMEGLDYKNKPLAPVQTKYIKYDNKITVTLFQFVHENQQLWMVQNTSFGSAFCSGNRGNAWRIVDALETGVEKFIVSCRCKVQTKTPHHAFKIATLISKEGIHKVCNHYEKKKPLCRNFITWTRKNILPLLTLTETK